MKRPAIELAQMVILACKAKNIKHIVISPGSRNAPLTIGFSNDSFFTCYSVVDERCAAFFALGIAQQIKHPVAMVCTSGSALLNYYPAVSEAFYSDIPLVVISADRPLDKIDIGDGQTIRQQNIFANHSAYNANLSDRKFSNKSNEYELNRALNTAIERQAPVHINVPFEEPLYLTTEESFYFENQPIEKRKPYINPKQKADFIKNWNQSSKKMVLVGVLSPNSLENKYINLLANDPSVLVLTETTSNLHNENFIPYIDKLLTFTEKDETLKEKLRPELLLTFGGLVVSKKIKQFLRKFQPKFHYHIDLQKGYDSYFCLTNHFQTDINFFFNNLSPELQKNNTKYRSKWLKINEEIHKKHLEYISEIPYSDLRIYELIFSKIPKNQLVQLSNSSTVRYAQLFKSDPSWKIFCNRGTSGIDGSISTAIGAAVGSKSATLLITGDLSFFYDSNGLWNKYIPKSFRIILINNQGGGIFRILPGDKSDKNFETYFETPHQLTAEHLCKMYGWGYSQTNDLESLEAELKNFFDDSEHPKLLEINTPRLKNDKVLLNYFHFLKN
ncbi:2-succinyl-5-enolpyruvyl-6-hydroxy-3-cyclohexene-1-carboxylic-acid synthase [Capnocytophaga felis]|uniref:2-succinyl-5-enolpyruvyl-6-hydroxy-3-cyclohexene-1-carboxylate synthase n=1 Tax=Capnocytophaga felis TaxID=2267611 RepID=A0A5M4B5K9_9FLAO|nr:2-succinyl-5-enolpyruvyl-6-hydroxy-3-cyclohexene-1-carboxylic-acid synthase [Capnocytophaga felis]GET44829.1 2-succinyl-5-enolpyruvyl-6-hydroxy-3-cyclohexene- 1-carboxylate synthase [Capnocytophaga felis]GET48644.1 2-succinyl-5-enolpyruvyl-6-hydroxy-3-cyclohexene- 1-carboxylate synthase [Capnocytophaga felis]